MGGALGRGSGALRARERNEPWMTSEWTKNGERHSGRLIRNPIAHQRLPRPQRTRR